MFPQIELVFLSLDGMKLYRRPDGIFLVQSEQEFLSIVGCLMIEQHSNVRENRHTATKFLNSLKNNKVYSSKTKKFINKRW